MKKELDYFTIGESCGGNQDWFTDDWMYRGGCGALTACDTCIYLARYKDMAKLCPFDAQQITKEQYVDFGMQMKPFLSPRRHGINRTYLYADGFRDYLRAIGVPLIGMDSIQGNVDIDTAKAAIRAQIDSGLPVAYLMLMHTDEVFKDYNWHWFLLVGYEESEEGFFVKAVTYGEYEWLDLDRVWNTGYEEKGGFVLYYL